MKISEDVKRRLAWNYLIEQPFRCECLKCGNIIVSVKHCRDIKCPKCGGSMRRIERPGPGR